MAKWSNNKYSRVTTNGVIAHTITPNVNFTIVAVKLAMNLTGGTAENFVVSVDSHVGPTYDIVLFSQDMEDVKDLYWSPDKDMTFQDGDSIVFTYANTGERIYGLEVIYRQAI